MTESPDNRPPHVALLVDFVNTLDCDEGTDALDTPASLAAWLTERGLLPDGRAASRSDHRLALRLRSALHDALVAHHDAVEEGPELTAVAALLPLRLALPAGGPGLQPVAEGVRGALGEVLVATLGTAADGTWHRLKVCAAADCAWAFFDASKNRSRAWCEWGCGNKAKTRSYRARRRTAAAPA